MSLIGLALAQLVAPLLAVLGALTGGGFPLPTALIIAAVAPVTAPTTTYAVIERRNATGPFVDRALGVLAINDAATILIFSVISAATVAWIGARTSGAEAWTALRQAAAGEALSLLAGPGSDCSTSLRAL